MKSNLEAFGNWLNVRRSRAGLTQEQLGQEACGYDRTNVNPILRGRKKPSRRFLAGAMVYLWRIGMFSHPDEVVYGVSLLGKTTEDLASYVMGEPDDERSEFLAWLSGWTEYRVDLSSQTASLPQGYVERCDEIDRLRSSLTDSSGKRSICLWGMGGIGKTTLAKAVATDATVSQHFHNGVLWAELGPEGDPRSWLATWCQLLGVSVDEEATIYELRERLTIILAAHWRRYLFVLDDVWWAEDVELLLFDGPLNRMLITCRELHIVDKLSKEDGVIELGGMRREESCRLVEIQVGASLWNEKAAEELADLVEDLPIALHLGAAVVRRANRWGRDGWSYLLRRLRKGCGSVDMLQFSKPERRQQSLRWTLDISYGLLNRKQQRILRALGVYRSGAIFSAADAASIVGKEMKPSLLEELVDLSILQRVRTSDGEHLYRFHPLVGHYVADRLRDSGELILYVRQYFGLCLVWMSQNLRLAIRSFFVRSGSHTQQLSSTKRRTRSLPLLCYNILTLLGAKKLAEKLLCPYL